MPTACQRFFDIPELVAALDPFLQNNDHIRLLRTCRFFYNLFAPHIWSNLNFTPSVTIARFFKSPEGMHALRRYTSSVQALETSSSFFTPYMDAVLAFARSSAATDFTTPDADVSRQLKQLSLTPSSASSSSTTTSGPKIVPPKWLLQHQNNLSQTSNNNNIAKNNNTILSLPPMTNLTKFHGNLTRFDHTGDITQSLQICWFLRLNPCLTDVRLVNVPLNNADFTRVFPRTLSGLTRLSQLYTESSTSTSVQAVMSIFSSCPISLEVWSMNCVIDYTIVLESNSTLVNDDKDEDEDKDEDDEDEDDGFSVAPRNGPLPKLTRLTMPTYRGGFPTSDIEFFLKDCPALEMWVVPPLLSTKVSHEVGNLLHIHCPKLRQLVVKDASRCHRQPQDFVQIMNSMPAGQLESLAVMQFSETAPGELWDAIRPHHKGGFRQVILFNASKVSSQTLQSLLRYCAGLKKLFVLGTNDQQVVLSLTDAAAFPWACLSLTHLHLAMDLSGTGADQKYVLAASVTNSEATLSPFVWTAEEQESWKKLEVVYTMLGSLVHLEMLTVRHVSMLSREYSSNSLPGLLTLGNQEMNQPGFLSKLEGLKKLKVFRGSVSALTDESKVMLRQQEVEWIISNWPKVELIDFLGYKVDKVVLPRPLQWLQQTRPWLKFH
ncbi:MAG: hypothetical protein J3R72DRAFT_241992 [Linnemannia gamsii]|nr:MAG: hypothetical protein J3R72DRAFT_241992 [Linnemannia gamsii]